MKPMTLLAGTDGCQRENILQRLVVAERRKLNDDPPKEVNEFDGQFGAIECLDRDRSTLDIGGLRDSTRRKR